MTCRAVLLLCLTGLLGLGVSAPLTHSSRPCWARHGVCPPTSTTTVPVTTTAPGTTATAPPTTTAATTTAATTTAPATTTAVPPPAYLFNDEFDGATLDTSKWWATPWCSSSSEDSQGCFNAANAYLNGQGQLVLRVSAGSMGRSYDFARIQTFVEGGWPPAKVLWSHSPPIRIEARIKMAAGAGIWEGPWADGANVLGPSVLELDYGEVRGAQPTVYNCNVHGPVSGGSAINTATDLTAGFHVYWVNYLADHAVFGIDSLTCGSFATPAQQEAIRLSVIVGPLGTWGGLGGPPAAAAIPAEMLVDYVRVTAR